MSQKKSFLQLPPAVQQVQAALGQRWRAMAPRERVGLSVSGLALLVLLIWWIGLAPALQTLRTAPVQRAALDQQLAQMQRLATEAAELRALPPVDPGQADAALQSATGRLGNAARLQKTGERISVTFTNVDASAMMSWLAEVRAAARARVIEAQLTRSGNAYNGSVVLTLPFTVR